MPRLDAVHDMVDAAGNAQHQPPRTRAALLGLDYERANAVVEDARPIRCLLLLVQLGERVDESGKVARRGPRIANACLQNLAHGARSRIDGQASIRLLVIAELSGAPCFRHVPRNERGCAIVTECKLALRDAILDRSEQVRIVGGCDLCDRLHTVVLASSIIVPLEAPRQRAA